jgi:hypothetical protein
MEIHNVTVLHLTSLKMQDLKLHVGVNVILTIDSVKLEELMNTFCNGNYNRFSRELGVDPSHLFRFIKTGGGGGKKMLGALITFCKSKDLNFEDYIKL